MTEFSTFKMNFRSADAANHMNRDAQHIPEVTRRAYIPKIQSLKSNTGPVGGQLAGQKLNDKYKKFARKINFS